LTGHLPKWARIMAERRKAVALISGGLDSMLAAKVVIEEGVHVEGLNFFTGFCVEGHTHAIRNPDHKKPKRNNDRVNIESLQPENTNAPSVTGGYLLRIDRLDGDERTFSTPTISITKSPNGTVDAGDVITYTFRVDNTSDTDAD
jgi:hypothetical protein